LASAIKYARSESHSGRIIIEQFLANAYSSSDTDSFSIDNELVFCSFNCQHFDLQSPNPYTPAAYSWPSDMPHSAQNELRREIQRLIRLLNLGTSIYNIETRVASDGKPYIMELSPRGGGNRLAEILKMATGVDIIKAAVCGALGLPFDSDIRKFNGSEVLYNGSWAEVIIHSNKDGRFISLDIDTDAKSFHVVQKDIWVNRGTRVGSFAGANQTIGTLVLKFDSHVEAEHCLSNSNWLKVVVE
jgi:biotin carboxylase